MQISVGAPWEIFRLSGLSTSSWHTVDAYTKAGGIGSYTAQYGILPDSDVGYSILAAHPDGDGSNAGLLEQTILLPVLTKAVYGIARNQALANFGGRYTSPATKSSLTLDVDAGPGLVITEFIYNGTNIISVLAALGLAGGPPRVYPSNLEDKSKNRVAFRLVPQPTAGACYSWSSVDSLRYGLQPLDELVFELGLDRKAIGVSDPGFRLSMKKVPGA